MLIKKSKIPFKAVLTTGIWPSFIKKLIYRAKGYTIGKNVSIGFGSVIIGKKVQIGDNVKIGIITIIRAKEIKSERFVNIGSMTIIDTVRLFIGEDARINEQVIIGGLQTPQSSLDLGKRTIIMEYSYINTTMPIKIGDDTGIGGHCLLFTHGSWLNQLDGFPVAFAPITLGNNVWLPWRVFIMPGVTIGDKVVVGANSLINKSFESNCLIAGSPAKVVKENFPNPITDEQKESMLYGFIDDFIKHLTYNNIPTTRKEEESEILITGIAKKVAFDLIINTNKINISKSYIKDTLVITNVTTSNNTLPKSVPKKVMILDVYNTKRVGTSAVGEEFVKFVSRYGLRFDRVD
jgi:acetyltransferase-like isoleucine patch superfamily enzyme